MIYHITCDCYDIFFSKILLLNIQKISDKIYFIIPAMSEEEKLREEAARRLARRRRKMENASERLSMITGQPAESIRLIDSYSIDPREGKQAFVEIEINHTCRGWI